MTNTIHPFDFVTPRQRLRPRTPWRIDADLVTAIPAILFVACVVALMVKNLWR